jgi:hypothetical protein
MKKSWREKSLAFVEKWCTAALVVALVTLATAALVVLIFQAATWQDPPRAPPPAPATAIPPAPFSPRGPPSSPMDEFEGERLSSSTCRVEVGGIFVSLSGNGRCEDGGDQSVSAVCPLGTDFPDCDERFS